MGRDTLVCREQGEVWQIPGRFTADSGPRRSVNQLYINRAIIALLALVLGCGE